jgi:hypothetical protein
MAAAGIIDTVKQVKPLTPLGDDDQQVGLPDATKSTLLPEASTAAPAAAAKPLVGAPGANEQGSGTVYTDTPAGDPNGDPGGGVPKPTTPPIPVTTQPTPAPIDTGSGAINPASRPPGLPDLSSRSNLSPNPGQTTPAPAPAPAPTPAPTPTPDATTTGASAVPAAPRVDTAGKPPAAPPPQTGTTAWSPTAGIVDQVRAATTQDVTGTGYTAATTPGAQAATTVGADATGYTAEKAPDAVGYDATGYDAATAGESLSQAVSRITASDSELLQRQQAAADQQANARGVYNSTMAVQAGRAAVLDKATELGQGDVQVAEFNAQQKNAASAFLADAKNVSAQFLAAAKNQNGMFNAEQANQASAFTANAKNVAANALAAAQNTASMFNAGEANKQAQFAVDQLNQASRFAAEMDNAAKQFNANAFNEAQQRYTDAMNAALAAQNDAENLSRRDTAQLNESHIENQERVGGQITAASIGASAELQAASMASADRQNALAEQERQFNVSMSQREREFVSGLSASQFNTFQQGLSAGLTTELEPDARQAWLHNYMSVWAASGTLPFNINVDNFPAPGSTGSP